MKNISEYINEARTTALVEIEYTPKNREELIDAIVDVTKAQSRRKMLDFNCIDTRTVTDMSSVFPEAAKRVKTLSKRDFKCHNWNVSNVTSFKDLFRGMNCFTGYMLDKWNVSEKCVNIEGMFADTGLIFIDFSGWKLDNVNSINEMFYNCESLRVVGFPRGMQKLQSMQEAFIRASALLQVELPVLTGKIKTFKSCFNCAGGTPFRIYNLDRIRCEKNADFSFMFAYAVPRLEDIRAFIKANNLTYDDCKSFKIENSILMKIEDSLNR